MLSRVSEVEPLFLKDPHSTELGKSILRSSIFLIDKLGLEDFTFRKLAIEIGATEPSIYRYFESKQRLLLYLTDWYWSWLEYRILHQLAKYADARERLDQSLILLSGPIEYDPSYDYVDERVLYKVVVAESSKVYLHKQVDKEQRLGHYNSYTRLTDIFAQLIVQINPNYPFAHALASTLIETAHIQQFFATHIPELTECTANETTVGVRDFLKDLIARVLC
jgi:AcrR family transcriptional regulator